MRTTPIICAVISLLLGINAFAGPVLSGDRMRLKFRFLCDYPPHDGATKFASSLCADPDALRAADPKSIDSDIRDYWADQRGHIVPMYYDLYLLMFESDFRRAYPPAPRALPAPAKLAHMLDEDVCHWWRDRGHAAAADELSRRNVFTPRDLRAVKEKKVFVGISESALLCAFGAPLEINRIVTAGGESKQYVYRGIYVYTDNGVVTAFQDSR